MSFQEVIEANRRMQGPRPIDMLRGRVTPEGMEIKDKANEEEPSFASKLMTGELAYHTIAQRKATKFE